MALKLLKTHEANNKTAKVYRDAELNEHRVKFYRDGRYQMGFDYQADSVDDAHGMAEQFINRVDEEKLFEFLVQTYANGTKNKIAHVHKDLNNGTFKVAKLHNNRDAGSVEFDHSHHAHEYAKKFINEETEPKLSKSSVDYSDGMGDTRCKNCAHYCGNHACELVEGNINPEYWCKKFKMKSLKEDGAMAAGPTNSVGSGAVAGLGVGKQGEPGVDKKRKRSPVMMALLKRKAPK